MILISLMLIFHPLYSYVLVLIISSVLHSELHLFLHSSVSLCLCVFLKFKDVYIQQLYADGSHLKHKICPNCFKLLLLLSVNSLLFCFSFRCAIFLFRNVYAKYIYASICRWLQGKYIGCGVKRGCLLGLDWDDVRGRPKSAEMGSEQNLVTVTEQGRVRK